MATVAYKRRLFPVQLLKARPMAASLGAPGLIIMRNRGGFDKNRGNPENFFFSVRYFFTSTFLSEKRLRRLVRALVAAVVTLGTLVSPRLRVQRMTRARQGAQLPLLLQLRPQLPPRRLLCRPLRRALARIPLTLLPRVRPSATRSFARTAPRMPSWPWWAGLSCASLTAPPLWGRLRTQSRLRLWLAIGFLTSSTRMATEINVI